MARKIALTLLWLGFILYAFAFAPPDQPDTLDLILRMSTGDWTGINPTVIALFNLMGIWPMIYASLLLVDGRGQKIPAFPFVVGSFALGAFAILPYLVLRDSNPQFQGKKNGFLHILDSRWLGVVLLGGAIALLAWAITQGDWNAFIQDWQTHRFIQVMSLDFCLLCLLFPLPLGDDLTRRKITHPHLFWLISLIPLFGPLGYLCFRPPLPETDSPPQTVAKVS